MEGSERNRENKHKNCITKMQRGGRQHMRGKHQGVKGTVSGKSKTSCVLTFKTSED